MNGLKLKATEAVIIIQQLASGEIEEVTLAAGFQITFEDWGIVGGKS